MPLLVVVALEETFQAQLMEVMAVLVAVELLSLLAPVYLHRFPQLTAVLVPLDRVQMEEVDAQLVHRLLLVAVAVLYLQVQLLLAQMEEQEVRE